MNFRVLVYMNPLVFNKISKKFIPEKDSGFLYTKQLIASLPQNWRFTILVPKGVTAEFFDSTHNIECVRYDYATSIHQNRYHFNRNIISKALPFTKDIDIVINNQPEVTANLRVFFKVQRREYPLIINLFHWIDCKESSNFANGLSGFIFRQVEGYNEADLNLFHNNYALKLFTQSANENNLPLHNGTGKDGFFHPQPTEFGTKRMKMPDKKIILFNHRLNNSTNWQEVIKICEKIWDDRKDFVLWITDENRDEYNYELSEDWILAKNVPFENYGYLLQKSHFSICNVKGYATWNMSMLDSLHYDTPVITQNTTLMQQLGGDVTDNLELTIRKFLDQSKQLPTSKKGGWYDIYKKDFDYVTWVNKTILARIKGKNPKKYDQVCEWIEKEFNVKLGTYKRDIVNLFWQFHANSNFQKIRWKLLSDGYVDNINKSDTSYNIPNTKLEKPTIPIQTKLN